MIFKFSKVPASYLLVLINLLSLNISCSSNYIPSLYEEYLIDHVQKSIKDADCGNSKLIDKVLNIPGMTSDKVKRLLNNLCSLSNSSYLEIGVWQGATFTAALFDNHDSLKQVVAMDNWSEFAGPQKEFAKNCSDCIVNIPYQFYSHDCFAIDKEKVFNLPVNIYFYNGNHSEESQEKAFTYYDSVLAPVFIAIVDDWNWKSVKTGTKRAFEKLGYTVLFECELPAHLYGSDKQQWWNGLYVAVIKK